MTTDPKIRPDPVTQTAADSLSNSLGTRVFTNYSLAPLTSFKVGGPASIFVEPQNENELSSISAVVEKFRLPCMVLGRGTNLLISDHGFPGVVVRLGAGFEWIKGEGSSLKAGGATPLPQVSNWAARRSLAGLEFAVAIPATVGGAVRMNAGAHHSQIGDVLVSARIWRLEENAVEDLSTRELGMTYRQTGLSATDVVCSAEFRLAAGARDEIAERMRHHRAHRTSTQPAESPNAGSSFKNPPGDSAGRLIEAAGLKGMRTGGAEVSKKHANFILAHPGAASQDVYDLLSKVQSAVHESAGILLLPEVRLVGYFDEKAGKLRLK